MGDEDSLKDVRIGPPSRTRQEADKVAETAAKDKSYGIRSFVQAWKKQQEADRKMRGRYANLLIGVLILQVVLANSFFALLGFRLAGFRVDPWVAQTFLVTTFLEVSSLVLIVAKYLFPAPTDKSLEVIGGLSIEPFRSKKGGRSATPTSKPVKPKR